jgi:hypothetical protein
VGRVTAPLGLASIVVIVVQYLRDSELAALFLPAALGLFLVSSRIDPEG